MKNTIKELQILVDKIKLTINDSGNREYLMKFLASPVLLLSHSLNDLEKINLEIKKKTKFKNTDIG